MSTYSLRRIAPGAISGLRSSAVDRQVEARVEKIISDIRAQGEAGLRRWAEELGDVERGAPLLLSRSEIAAALERTPESQRLVLERVAARIRAFADHQRNALKGVEVEVPGGRAGHSLVPVEVAGCYAPGGRYPLPSSVLMTAITARAAGVERVWLASPRPSSETLAAAALAGVDGMLAVGGAQAIAAMAVGVGGVPRCDVVVGPGNVWVTAAKRLLAGEVGIDLLAGPSELIILADDSADPELIAADLLAQAEHDGDALPLLVTPAESLIEDTEVEIARQLSDLPTAETARISLRRGGAVLTDSLEQAIEVANRLAPEHLQILCREPATLARRCRNYGGLFIGAMAPEVLGDYGAGPNHTLPTGGSARYAAGLSVFHFLAPRTWIEIDEPAAAAGLYGDAAALAGMEGLEAHRRAAELRSRRLAES